MSDPYSNDDDITGGGSYLPSLPKLYQGIFDKLGMNGPPVPTEMPKPPQGMQDFYNAAFRALGFPDSPQNPNRTMPSRSMVRGMFPPPQSNFPSRPQAVAPNPYVTDAYPARPQAVVPSSYTTDNFPARPYMQSAQRQGVTDPLQRTLLGLDDDGTEVTQSSGGSQLSDPRAVRALDPSARPYRPLPDEGGGSDNTPLITSGMIPSTGRAHMTSPIIPKNAVASKGRAHMSASSQEESDLPASKEAGDTGEFLNNDPDDMRPGSLGEAQKLFPGRPLQQAIYYTEPEHGKNGGGGGMRRLGVGADTKGLNPDYIARIWEPADMSGGEKFIRGAYETPGKNPITWSPEKAKGGSIDAAQKIANQKATPCHVGPITMAVGGRTDHIPMNVLEGSYVLPADIVSGLGEGNTLAGTKLIDNMFTKGPFGVSAKAPQFSAVPKPSLGEYGSMKELFHMNDLGQVNSPQKAANGGPIMSGKYRPVPIVAAGGEYVIHPDVVAKLGNGNMERGHNYLDNFVKGVRKHLVKTLSKLPGPRRD